MPACHQLANRRRRLVGGLLLATLALTSGRSRAETGLAVGAAVGARPALSVQYETAPRTAYHVTAYLGDASAALTADYQRFLVPGWGRGLSSTLAFYAGLGLGGESNREAASEDYHLRLPVGIQYDIQDLRLSTFAEVAATVGALPTTTVAGVLTGGVRAHF